MGEAPSIKPLASVIRLADDGSFFLEGSRCTACGEVLVGAHLACPKCAAEESLEPIRLAEKGRLYTYTIVHRSFPGVKTPIISAVVELDGGGFLKGNLMDVPPEPSAIRFDMPVQILFDLLDAPEEPGTRLLRYVFVPDQRSAA